MGCGWLYPGAVAVGFNGAEVTLAGGVSAAAPYGDPGVYGAPLPLVGVGAVGVGAPLVPYGCTGAAPYGCADEYGLGGNPADPTGLVGDGTAGSAVLAGGAARGVGSDGAGGGAHEAAGVCWAHGAGCCGAGP